MVGIIVRSTTGSVLVHQRAADKDVWPSMWDVMVGGVVSAGETYEVAARRELNEEIGVEPERCRVIWPVAVFTEKAVPVKA